MSKIHHLPPHIIAKIAAGEVIERPAYAVKELIENAIDAKAAYITVQIEEAGLRKIVVTDNGEGMSKEDIQECFKPHTTSKISDEENLVGITSLGFRGEALSSIAAISTMTIKSRTENESSGSLVSLKNGNIEKISPIGMPVGTSITVDNLFHNVPVRKKFLKTPTTEFRHILEIIMHYAISFPNTRFFLSHNKKIIVDLPKNQNLLERIRMLLGNDVFAHLLPLRYEESYVTISGFISKPQITTYVTNKHFIFINQRKVTDKLITTAIKEAYGNLLETTAYPIFILFLTMPYEMVDVNVHPRKEQVSFVDNKIIFDAVRKAVRETLQKKNITFSNMNWLIDETSNKLSLHDGNTRSYAGKLLKNLVLPSVENETTIIKSSDIVQLHNLFLITQTSTGFIFIDQHAAHERILFEKFSEEFKKQKNKNNVYHLSNPITFDVSFSDNEVLSENIKLFETLGFIIEHFQGNTFKINAVPNLFQDRNPVTLIKELLDDLVQEKQTKSIDQASHRMLAYLACRSAIKAGDKITKSRAKELLEDLEKTPNNAICPHGRPTKIEMSLKEVNRMFKRG